MPFCNKCGTEVPENTNFCPKCGGQQGGGQQGRFKKDKDYLHKAAAKVLLVCLIAGFISVAALFITPWINAPWKNESLFDLDWAAAITLAMFLFMPAGFQMFAFTTIKDPLDPRAPRKFKFKKRSIVICVISWLLEYVAVNMFMVSLENTKTCALCSWGFGVFLTGFANFVVAVCQLCIIIFIIQCLRIEKESQNSSTSTIGDKKGGQDAQSSQQRASQ